MAKQAPLEKTEIQCPKCKVIYEVEEVLYTSVTCLKCGETYLQAVHSTDRPEFIRQALYRCRGVRYE